MSRVIVALLIFTAVAIASIADEEQGPEFSTWASTHQRSYSSAEAEIRFSTWKENRAFIEKVPSPQRSGLGRSRSTKLTPRLLSIDRLSPFVAAQRRGGSRVALLHAGCEPVCRYEQHRSVYSANSNLSAEQLIESVAVQSISALSLARLVHALLHRPRRLSKLETLLHPHRSTGGPPAS